MKSYHGSTVLVERPELRAGAVYLDFGVGFYTTTSYEQALRWAKIKMRREQIPVGYVSVYDFDLETAAARRHNCAVLPKNSELPFAFPLLFPCVWGIILAG